MVDVGKLVEGVEMTIEATELDWKAKNGGDDASCVDCPDEIKARAAILAVLRGIRDWDSNGMMEAARHDWNHNHGPQSQTLYGENIVGIHRAIIDHLIAEVDQDA